MSKALTRTDFNFPGQKNVYHGKVRDVYNINDEKLVMVATELCTSSFCTVFVPRSKILAFYAGQIVE